MTETGDWRSLGVAGSASLTTEFFSWDACGMSVGVRKVRAGKRLSLEGTAQALEGTAVALEVVSLQERKTK